VSSGATYKTDVLQGKSYSEIVDAMSEPTSDVAKGAVGTGNVFSAIICQTTGGEPGNVCDTAGVRAAQSAIPTS
jgi:hypothetical protein